jgi:hypothetical protein
MKCNKRSIVVVSALFAVLLSLSPDALNARDAEIAPFTVAAVHSSKRQCINTCRARYRDCLAKKQIPAFECQGVYQDCVRLSCNASQGQGW